MNNTDELIKKSQESIRNTEIVIEESKKSQHELYESILSYAQQNSKHLKQVVDAYTELVKDKKVEAAILGKLTDGYLELKRLKRARL